MNNNLLFISIISIFFAVLLFNPNLRPNVWDSYEYINTGKAIAQGEGYIQSWNPDEPRHWRSIGYPLILSLLIYFSDNLIFLKILSLLFYIGNFILVYFMFSKIFRLPNVITLIFSLIFSLNQITLTLSNSILSDTPYLLMQLLSLTLASKYVYHARDMSIYSVLIPFFMFISWQIRSIGLVLILSTFLYFIAQKQYNKSLLMAGFLTPLIFFVFFFNGSSGGVLDNYNFLSTLKNTLFEPQSFIQLIYNGLTDYFHIIPKSLFGFFYDAMGHFNLHKMAYFSILSFIISLMVIILIILGYIQLMQSQNLYGYFVPFYIAVLIVYPWNFERAIFPIFPFLLIYFYYGLKLIIEKLSAILGIEKNNFILKGVCVAILFLSSGEKLYRAFVKNENIVSLYNNGISSYPTEWQNYFMGLFWLKTNIPNNSIVMTRDSSLCYLISGKKSVSIEDSKNVDDVKSLLNIQNVDYVITNSYYKNSHEKFLFEVVKKNPDKFLKVYNSINNGVRIFKVV